MPDDTRGLGAGRQAWRAFVDSAIASADSESTPFTLARVCLLVDGTVPTPGEWELPDLPGGRPDRATIRAAGTALLHYGARRDDAVGCLWQLLGGLRIWGQYKQVDVGAQTLEDVLEGLRQAAGAGFTVGPEFEAWVLIRRSVVLRDGLRDRDALDAAERALALLQTVPAGNGDRPHPTLQAATAGATWVVSAARLRTLLRYNAHSRAAMAARMLRQYERAVAERDQAIVLARTMRDRPLLRCQAYGERVVLARTLGDVNTALRLLAEQREDAEQSGSRHTYLRHQLTAAGIAVLFDDWDEAIRLFRERITGRFDLVLGTQVNAASPEAVLAAVPALREAGRHAAATAVGNDAYELARCLIESGKAGDDQAARTEAAGWLDVAEAGYGEIAMNGTIAIEFRRLELAALSGEGDRLAIGRAMVDSSRRWRRAAGRRKAAIKATQYCDPTDRVVLDRLHKLIIDAPAIDAAHLALGMARWHLRHGNAVYASGDPGAAGREWQDAVQHATTAVTGLTFARHGEPEILLDPAAVVEAHQIRGWALRNLRNVQGGPSAAAAELDARLKSLPAIARRFTACGSPGQRAVLDRLYRRWLVETLELAVEVQDPDAADITAEVARRDLVGTVLFTIVNDQGTPEQIARLAEQLVAALGTKVAEADSPSGTSPGSSTDSRGDDDEEPAVDPLTRGSNIAEQITGTLDVVGAVLGPVARDLFDPQTVTRHTTRTAATALYGDGPGAILSLVLLDGDCDNPQVLRHLIWRTAPGEPLHDLLDIVPAPTWLAGLSPDPDQDQFFARLALLTDVLLPGPLIEALASANETRPFPLAVVPTGLLAVPFAALRAAGTLVLERAVVSVAQSLQALENLANARMRDGGGLDLGVYDTDRLKYADAEWQALLRHRPGTREARTLDDIDRFLGDPTVGRAPGLLALAVHGMRGRDGWTQAKQLPSGEMLTTGHVLRWYVPALVVGASCNTDIRVDSGGELGGFPLAFQLRGAVNIVGSLHYIEDAATAEIMALFYEATSNGLGTAAGLRAAQRQWLATDRRNRVPTYQRWAYLVTYGLPA